MKKIVSSIIVIMIIISFTFVYATQPVDSGNVITGQIQFPENGDISKEDEKIKVEQNQNTNNNTGDKTDSSIDGDNSSSINPDGNDNNDVNSDTNGETGGSFNSTNNQDQNNSIENEGADNRQDNNEINGIESDKQPEQQKPQTSMLNNSNASNNNSYVQLKSSEARLKDLKVDVEGLTPEFNKNTTEYYLVVDLNVNKIKVTASTVDNKAKWAIYGDNNLKEGENTVTIVVTAEDGTKKEYYIYVTKVDDVELANAELDSLEIVGYNIYPSFKANIYSYNLNINKKINSLDIKAITKNENATIKIEGNESLKEGENIIKINVIAENKETIRTYKINTYISLDKVEIQEESKLTALILIIVLGTIIIVLGVSIVLKNRR